MNIKLKQVQYGSYMTSTVEKLKESLSIGIIPIHQIIYSANNVIKLAQKPLEDRKIILEVNGVKYIKDEDFTVNYQGKEIRWIKPQFDLDELDEVTVHYEVNIFDGDTESRDRTFASGNAHNLLIKMGTVWSWGYNQYGQLGDGTFINRSTPVKIDTLKNIRSIAAGVLHCVALDNYGDLYSWGYNGSGQLGLNSDEESIALPTKIPNIPTIKQIACGQYHTLALDVNGDMWTWGHNGYGQLGNGTKDNSKVPTKIQRLENVIKIEAGELYSAAITLDGSLWMWGNGYHGQLGNGTNNDSTVPTRVDGINLVKEIFTGYDTTHVVCQDGTVFSWGDNYYGQLGNGTNEHSNIPVQVMDLTDIVSLQKGSNHILALDSSGRTWTWGHNEHGQLGNNSYTDTNRPIMLKNIENASDIGTCYSTSYILESTGNLLGFGNNDMGQLATDTFEKYPVPIDTNMKDVNNISCGSGHIVVSKNDDTLWSWGANEEGQLGTDSSDEFSSVPTMIKNISIS